MSETHSSSRPNNHPRASGSRGGFRGRGRGRGGRFSGSSRPQGEFMRTSSAGAPDKTFKPTKLKDTRPVWHSPNLDSESPSEGSPPISSPIGDLYTFYASLLLQEAQPYPGDVNPVEPGDGFDSKRFLMYLISDDEYIVMDNESDFELTLSSSLLHDESFKPALWYAQARCFAVGLDAEAPLGESRFQEEIGDAQSCAVKIMLEHREVLRGYETAGTDRYEVWALDGDLAITHHDSCMMLNLPRALLEDPKFDLSAWYDDASANYWSFDSSESGNDEPPSTSDGSWSMAELDSLPSLQSGSESELSDGSETDSMPSLQAVSRTVSEVSADERPPDLQSVSDSSDGESDEDLDPETFEDRLEMWALAAELCGQARTSGIPSRAYRLGDVLGNTVAAMLDFFQPYPGDELIAWSDGRRDTVRFRVLGPYAEFYTIEDTYSDEVTILAISNLRSPYFHLLDWYARKRARDLDLEYNRALPIHNFPIEELLGDAIQQYFRDVGRDLPV
ncbi:hypothetical protein C8R44DRAFT_736964 [Mycena epipterygia]|nr:hypothetical protein C8R44DRAFT_736964 [Mycena epipterygia]